MGNGTDTHHRVFKQSFWVKLVLAGARLPCKQGGRVRIPRDPPSFGCRVSLDARCVVSAVERVRIPLYPPFCGAFGVAESMAGCEPVGMGSNPISHPKWSSGGRPAGDNHCLGKLRRKPPQSFCGHGVSGSMEPCQGSGPGPNPGDRSSFCVRGVNGSTRGFQPFGGGSNPPGRSSFWTGGLVDMIQDPHSCDPSSILGRSTKLCADVVS